MADSNPNTPHSSLASNGEAPAGALDGATQKLAPVDAAAAAAAAGAGAGAGAGGAAAGAGGAASVGGAGAAATAPIAPAGAGAVPSAAGPVSSGATGATGGSMPGGASGSTGAGSPVSGPAGASASRKASDASSESLSNDAAAPQGTVASRRLAHGLSPETTTKAEAAELRRKEKEASAEERKRKFQKKQRAKMARRSVVAVVVVLLVGVAFAFWLLRWGLHDDASSIQGQWRVQGTDTIINITDKEIVLTDEVAYDYVLDPESKTLEFTFGGLTGSGRYRFSLNHSMLSIDDGEFDWGTTLASDVPWMLDAVAQELVGNPEKSPSLGEGDMVLERIS